MFSGSVPRDGPHYSFRSSASGFKGGKKARFQWKPTFKGSGGRGGFRTTQGGFGKGQPKAGILSAQCMPQTKPSGTKVVPSAGWGQEPNRDGQRQRRQGQEPVFSKAPPPVLASPGTPRSGEPAQDWRASSQKLAKPPNRPPPSSFLSGGAVGKRNFEGISPSGGGKARTPPYAPKTWTTGILSRGSSFPKRKGIT